MKVTVLQGVNLENLITTIKIECDSTPNTVLIDEVKSLHPLFLEEYKVEGKTISIQSKLPHLWKEIAVALNNYSIGEWSYDLTKTFIFQTAIKLQLLSMSTIPILHGAHELGYETTQYFIEEGFTPEGVLKKFNRYYAIGIGKEAETVISIASTMDSGIAKMVQRDKWLTNIMLERLKLPIAKWELIKSREDLKELHEKYEKPYVIKPVGLTGGHGVTTNINSLEQAEYAYDFAIKSIGTKENKKWQRKIMIQNQVYGSDYRILVIDGKMEIATERIPAFVTGDGKSSIKQLIEETNKDPRRDIAVPTHILKPIVIDESLTNYLAEQNLNLEHIPNADEKVFVRKVASMSQGGITEDYTQKVNPQIKYIVESLARSLHAYALGVDVICKDISKPLTPENGSIIECNTMPESYLNAFPVIGKQYPNIGKIVVNGLVGKKPRTNKYVYIGNSEDKFNTFISLNTSEGEVYGVYRSGNIFINGELLNTNIQTWKAVEALKLNASLDTIILCYNSIEEVKNDGFGFDNIDLIVTEKELENDPRYTRISALSSSGVVNRVETI
jgi:cyanophycin synthetase